jgi:hypothetical protein
MSQAASQAWAFYREVARTGVLWTLRDHGGFPAPLTPDGKRAQPFWSSLSRVRRIIKNVPAYKGFEPYEISWSQFVAEWVPSLMHGGLLAGVNWSGPYAKGYDIEPERLRDSVQAVRERSTA